MNQKLEEGDVAKSDIYKNLGKGNFWSGLSVRHYLIIPFSSNEPAGSELA